MTSIPPNLSQRASDTSPESPWPVRMLSMKIAEYVERMSSLWVEGQIVQLNRRPGAHMVFLTLRDVDVDMSLSLTVRANAIDAMGPLIKPGARVIAQAKPTFWTKRGTLQLEARTMRPVGEGELLLRLEQLKTTLRAEGLFNADRKQPLPFLPGRIGLIVGRASAAEKDVVENARRRWPAAEFVIRNVAVQGPDTVPQVSAALAELDAEPSVDVIVIARGGGSFEDLLGFSNESLIRAVSEARTPVVSAIGHDIDTPLLDFVADVRASTPTDAAKLIVPDFAAEQQQLRTGRDRLAQGLRSRFATEQRHLNTLVSRPALRDPSHIVEARRADIDQLRNRTSYAITQQLRRGIDQITHQRAQVKALSPHQTLERGYAVVQLTDGVLVTNPEQVDASEVLKITVAQGNFAAKPLAGDMPANASKTSARKTSKIQDSK